MTRNAQCNRPALRVSDITAGYGDLTVLNNLSLVLAPGTCTAILGPNGAGKSTLMKCIAGTLSPNGGSIELPGVDASTPKERIQNIGWAPEGRMLFTDFSIRDNLFLSARAAGAADSFAESMALVSNLFPFIADRRNQQAGSLSGGQQQMVAIARAMVRKPVLMLLDEPSMGIAPKLVEDIGAAVAALRESGMTVLVAEQNISWLTDRVDSVRFMTRGSLSKVYGPEVLSDRDVIRNHYLGSVSAPP